MSRDGGKVHFAMQCKNNTKGTGDMVYSDGHYSGKFIIESPQGTMNISTEGEKLGTCDPAKTR
jgi:hypothetical protein